MEAVEDFVIGVAADFIVIINETVVDILSFDEFRQMALILQKYALKPLQLGFFLTKDQYAVTVVGLFPYIR